MPCLNRDGNNFLSLFRYENYFPTLKLETKKIFYLYLETEKYSVSIFGLKFWREHIAPLLETKNFLCLNRDGNNFPSLFRDGNYFPSLKLETEKIFRLYLETKKYSVSIFGLEIWREHIAPLLETKI